MRRNDIAKLSLNVFFGNSGNVFEVFHFLLSGFFFITIDKYAQHTAGNEEQCDPDSIRHIHALLLEFGFRQMMWESTSQVPFRLENRMY